jgi:UDP-sugar pyrophosphorylase
MTSDDTHNRTVKLLEDNDYFGMPRDQLSFMKQQKVPAMLDIKARFAQKPGTLEIETKPHGHGDMHTLIYSTGNSKKWLDQGKKWVCSFQDTNPLVFRGFPGLIGTSKKHNLEVNSMVVPRKVGEAADVAVVLKKEYSFLHYVTTSTTY